MRRSLWVANLGFMPVSMDLAVLFLRIALGISMIALHGWGKLLRFPTVVESFPNPLGLGRHLSLTLTILAEVLCSLLLIAGALTRFASAVLLFTMGVALFKVHGFDFSSNGAETAALYFVGFGALLISGGGRLSADSTGGPWSLAALAGCAGGLAGYPLSLLFQGAEYRDKTSLQNYLAGFREVLTAEPTRWTALTVWILTIIVSAAAGFWLGRLINRRSSRRVAGADQISGSKETVATPEKIGKDQ